MNEQRKYSFLVEVITTEDAVIQNRGRISARDNFKENIIRKLMKALADYPYLVSIDVDEIDIEDEEDCCCKDEEEDCPIIWTTFCDDENRTYIDLSGMSPVDVISIYTSYGDEK